MRAFALAGVLASSAPCAALAPRLALSSLPRRSGAGAALPATQRSVRTRASAERAAEDDREIATIAGPALLGTLADPFLSIVDTAWVSRLGTTALGAVAASSELFTSVARVVCDASPRRASSGRLSSTRVERALLLDARRADASP